MKRTLRAAIFTLAWSAVVTNVCGADYYVDIDNATPVPPYTNGWGAAANDIQSAVREASAHDTVWVAPGSYTATNAVIPPGGTNVVEITKPLTLRASGSATNTFIDGEGTNRCIYVSYSASAPRGWGLHGFTVTNGIAGSGGGIFFRPGLVMPFTMHDAVIADNTATNGSGGGICNEHNNSGADYTLVVSNCLIRNNHSLTHDGGGIMWRTRAPASIYDSVFEYNTATNTNNKGGGALYLDTLYEESPIENTVFRGNRAAGSGDAGTGGGVMWLDRVALRMRNCLLIGNFGYKSGAIFGRYRPRNEIVNTTVVSNRNTYVGGAAVYMGDDNSGAYFRMYNSILYHNTGGAKDLRVDPGITVEGYTNNCVSRTNGIPDFYTTGNITNEPAFVDLGSLNLRLSSDSRCIDAGYNQDWMEDALDLDGNLRKDYQSGIVDMGCYEFVPPPRGTTIMVQ